MESRFKAGAGMSLGALLALPAGAQAEDIQVTNLNQDGAGSLRAAVEQANDPDADRILFNSKLSGTISTGGIQLSVNYPVEIRGPGARQVTVSANNDTRAFNVATGFGDDVTISGLTITDGDVVGGSGGGIINTYADLTLSRVTIVDNTASNLGGGVFNFEGTLTVESSTVSGNTAEGSFGGGGLYSKGDLTVINSTISGNTSTTQDGGGIYIDNDEPGEFEIRGTTITDNSAADDGGGIFSIQDTELQSSIVAGNSADEQGPDVFSDLATVDASFSLLGDPSDSGITSGSGNLLNVDPKLKPLKNNGGPTDTHAFKQSPAKNKVPKGQSEKSDQRGAKRKGKGDIGAYELVKCEGVIVNRVGTAKKDKLKGTKRKDGILGLGGNDKLAGKRGKDGLCGGRGKDKLKGGPGKDKLDGGPGKDKEVQ